MIDTAGLPLVDPQRRLTEPEGIFRTSKPRAAMIDYINGIPSSLRHSLRMFPDVCGLETSAVDGNKRKETENMETTTTVETVSVNFTDNPFVVVLCIAVLVAVIAGTWKVFTKAGVPGWHSLIPILSTYDLCKIALKDSVGLLTVLCVLLPLVMIYPCIKLAKAFGKGTGFGVCLYLFSFIAYPILGFGDAEYLGPQ